MLKGRRVILASASPRRAELLKKLVENFEVMVSDVEESHSGGTPEEIAMEIASKKATYIAETISDKSAIIIAADTLVWHNGKEFGKPCDAAMAKSMLTELSGNTHQVYTGVCIIYVEKKISFCSCTDVSFYKLTEKEIDDYVATGEPMDKSGSYGIQDGAAIFVHSVNGDYPTVMGLPIAELYRILKDL